MRTLRRSLVGTVILVLLVGLGGPVLAQADDESGAFTMSVIEELSERQGTWQSREEVDEGTGLVAIYTVEASDPRLSGTWTEGWTNRLGGDFSVAVGRVLVQNEGGSWIGTVDGFQAPTYHASRTVLEGHGDYAGLTAILHRNEDLADEDPDRDGAGVVLDFSIPPPPSLAEAISQGAIASVRAPSIDPSIVPDADGFIFEEVAPGVRRLVTDGAGHFPSATFVLEARDMDELAVDERGRVFVWSTTHGIDNDLAGDAQLWVLGEEGGLDPGAGPPRTWDETATRFMPDGDSWSLGSEDGGGVIRSDGETAERFVAGQFAGSLTITPDGRVWAAVGHDPGEAGGIYVIEPDAVGEPVAPPPVEPPDEEVFLLGPASTEELLALARTEEVEPGVFRVVNDSLGPLDYPVDWEYPYDIVAGHDGGIYVLEPGHYTRLGSGHYRGSHKGFDWDLQDAVSSDVEVAPDGTVWAVFESPEGRRLYSVPWGSGHETRHLPTTGPGPIEVTSDGTVWAVWLDDPGDPDSTVFGYLEADGWTMVGEWPFDGYLRVSDRGEVWAVAHIGWGVHEAQRFVDGAWRTEEGNHLDPGDWGFNPPADVGPDGTLWGIRRDRLVRFDGTGWTTFEPPDWSRTDVAIRELAEDGWVPDELDRSRWGELHVARDGSLWVPPRLGMLGRDPDLGGGHQIVCGHGVDGVARFDGETWSRFLQGRCVEAMDIAPDGSVWLLASKSDARFPLARTYVITPEAVAAAE